MIDLDKLLKEREEHGHSVFAPSAAHRWMECPGSLIPNLMDGDCGALEAAIGTLAHDLAEDWLKRGSFPKHRRNDFDLIINGGVMYYVQVDREMVRHVESYVDWCKMAEGDQFIEQRVDFSDLTPIPNQGGTADHIACQRGVLTITDLKYGKGVQVFAENNPQALIYAYGAFRKYDHKYHFKTINIRICQPRLNHFDEWSVTRKELLAFSELVRDRANAAWSNKAGRKAGGKACTFCTRKATCSAMFKLVKDTLAGDFSDTHEVSLKEAKGIRKELREDGIDVSDKSPFDMSTADLAEVLKHRRTIEGWLRAVDNELEKRANDGQKIPGYKLVESRSNRKFRSEDDAVETLTFDWGIDEKDLFTRKMITPAQCEGVLVANGVDRTELADIMDTLVFKPPGKPTLAPESDKRKPIQDRIVDLWDDDDD